MLNYKIQMLILNNSNIDAHLEDEAGYSVVVPIEYNKVYHYLSINLGYDKDDVYDNLSFNVDIYKEELSLLISTNYHNTVTELFHQARIDEAEHEQQKVNKQSFNHTEQSI